MGRKFTWLAIVAVLVASGAVAVGLMVTHERATAFRTTETANPQPAADSHAAGPAPAGGSASSAYVPDATSSPAAVTASQPAGFVVSMSPMGDVHFPKVPERIVTGDANYNDILVSLQEDGHLLATGFHGNHYDGFYRRLPGIAVAIDPQKLTYLSKAGGGMFDKELLYSLHPDVFHIDPVQLATSKGWTAADVEEVSRNVAPFFANRYSRENSYAGKLPYTYYSVFELAQKVGEVYQRSDRIARLAAVYQGLVDGIKRKLPPEEQRPKIGLIFYSHGKFTPYSLLNGGFGQAQYRDVGARDAFATIKDRTYGASTGGALDLEGLVELAPEVLIMPFAIYPASSGSGTSRASYDELLKLEDDPLAQRIPAFRDGRVHPGGSPLQGPIFYLFQIEMAAKQLYPQIFGRYRDDQEYPLEEQLFDRVRVAEIVAGKTTGP